MRKSTIYQALLLAVTLAGLSSQVHADNLGSRRYGSITRINKGVFQLALETTLSLTFDQQENASLFRSNTVSSVAFRYFLKDNLGLSARGGFSYRRAGDSADSGFLGALWANYYMRMGDGMFVAPGVGAGFLSAQRQVPAGGGSISQSGVVAAVGAVEFTLAIFLGDRFHLTAGPEFLLSAGAATPTGGGQSASFLSVDGALKIGFGYSY